MTTLTCPRCRGMMQTYQRAGISVDQCLQCRGIFLDHGELEHILNAEKHYAPPPPPGYPQQPYPQQGYPQQHVAPQHGGHVPPPVPVPPPGGHAYYGHPRHGGHGYYGHPRHGGRHGYYGHRRHRRSFIQELFD